MQSQAAQQPGYGTTVTPVARITIPRERCFHRVRAAVEDTQKEVVQDLCKPHISQLDSCLGGERATLGFVIGEKPNHSFCLRVLLARLPLAKRPYVESVLPPLVNMKRV